MGWTYSHKAKLETIKQFFERHWNNENCQVLACKSYLHEAYLAVKNLKTNEVFAVVCLIHHKRGTKYAPEHYNFGYKDIEECCGPFYYSCPNSILDLLTPPSNETAAKWREQCRERNAKHDN